MIDYLLKLVEKDLSTKESSDAWYECAICKTSINIFEDACAIGDNGPICDTCYRCNYGSVKKTYIKEDT